MSHYRQQAMIDAPVELVWDLISDVNRHPEWWPRVVDVRCDGLDEGCTYREVVKTPFGEENMDMLVERLEGCEELAIRCVNTGTFVRMALTEAQGGTFVDGEIGMDPTNLPNRVFDAIAGKRYFRSWMNATLEALQQAADRRRATA